MNEKDLDWLSDEERKSYNSRHLLAPPGGQVVELWTKSLCETRIKLAKARGMLYSVKFKDYTEEELQTILNETAD